MSGRRGVTALLGMLVAALVCATAAGARQAAEAQAGPAQAAEALDTPAAEPETDPLRAALDAIHDDLVELRFEKALGAIEALLGQPELTDDERVEALVLRGQAHVAFGDLSAAEKDYGEILARRPGYVPDASLTPTKAMERFRKVQASLVGRLAVHADPPDIVITVDGRLVARAAGGGVPLLAGEHVVRAERAGFDPAERTVVVEPGRDTEVSLQLVPNARTVIVLTEPAAVEVRVDGVDVGRTRVPEDGRGAARLVIENLPLGEHVFELAGDCLRTERRREVLAVDLIDRGPWRLGPLRLDPARVRLELTGGPAGAEVLVDRAPAGRLPFEPLELCPGEHLVEVRYAGRPIWIAREELLEGRPRSVPVDPRPNAVLIGGESWPPALAALARLNLLAALPGSPAGVDLSRADAWQRLGLPDHTDVAVVLGGRSPLLYSPILETVVALDQPPPAERPAWTRALWGLTAADSGVGGPGRVARVAAGGGAAAIGLRAGDRLVALGGVEVSSATQVARVLSAASADAPLEVRWVSADGKPGAGEMRARRSPRVDGRDLSPQDAALRAAWARVDGLCDPERAPVALSNLALLLSEAGRSELAVATWRRVRWGDRAGLGDGTVLYYLGRDLERLGREAEAVEAFRRAAASEATAFDDSGPAIAPAAEDHLADLGALEPLTSPGSSGPGAAPAGSGPAASGP